MMMDQSLYPGSKLTVYERDVLNHLMGFLFYIGDMFIVEEGEGYDKKKFPKKQYITSIEGAEIYVIYSREAFDIIKSYNLKEVLNIIKDELFKAD